MLYHGPKCQIEALTHISYQHLHPDNYTIFHRCGFGCVRERELVYVRVSHCHVIAGSLDGPTVPSIQSTSMHVLLYHVDKHWVDHHFYFRVV